MNNIMGWMKEHLIAFLVTGVVLAGLLYAVTTSWQSEQKLASQAEQLGQIRGDLADIKKAFISMLLDKAPNKSEIIKGLVGDTQTLKGINQFKAGNFDAAYVMWLESAQQGSEDSAFAIVAANAVLKDQVTDMSLPQEQRFKAQEALLRAPNVKINDGIIKFQPKN
jgi:hypothetical protein